MNTTPEEFLNLEPALTTGNNSSIGPNSDSSAGTNKTVVYDTAKQTFYYTGSYGGGGGGGSATGSFTGSFTGSVSGTISDINIRSITSNNQFPVIFADGTQLGQDNPAHFHYNPSLDILVVNGTVSSSNFINVGTVAGSKITGSFTGSFTGSLKGTATIGPAEDDDYTDGLFTDFTSNTLVGTPIDRFNEVLKALAPSPAPNLSSLGDEETNFTSCSLSFGTTTNSIAGVTNVETVGTLAALNVSGTFSSTKSFDGGEDYRIGINNSISAQNITGKLNQATAENGGSGVTVNFSASAFGEGNVGKLFLYVNTGPTDGGVGSGTPTVELDLESSDGAITVDNTNGTLTVGATSSGFFPQGTAFTNFTHRTGSYVVKTPAQRNGMNFFRVIHTSSTFQRSTNYIQFLNATQKNLFLINLW